MDVNEGDEWDLQDILASGTIDIRSGFRGGVLDIQEKCLLYGLDVPVYA